MEEAERASKTEEHRHFRSAREDGIVVHVALPVTCARRNL
jgi:hypothetical protein